MAWNYNRAYKRKPNYKKYNCKKKIVRYRNIRPKNRVGNLAQRVNLNPGKMQVGFPQKLRTRLVYQTELTKNTGAAATHNFCANGLYDPDLTGTGHQPAQYDTFSGLYDRSTVVGGKFSVTFINNASVPIRVFVNYANDTSNGIPSASLSTYDFIRSADTKTKILTAATGSNNKCTLSLGYNFIKAVGAAELFKNNFVGTPSSNPSRSLLWALGIMSLDGTTTLDCTVSVDITYIVNWDGLLQSSNVTED